MRDTAAVLAKAKDDSKFKDLTSQLGTIVKTASNFSNISNIVFEVASIVGGFLEPVEDKPSHTLSKLH